MVGRELPEELLEVIDIAAAGLSGGAKGEERELLEDDVEYFLVWFWSSKEESPMFLRIVWYWVIILALIAWSTGPPTPYRKCSLNIFVQFCNSACENRLSRGYAYQ